MKINATFKIPLPENLSQEETEEKLKEISQICGFELLKWKNIN